MGRNRLFQWLGSRGQSPHRPRPSTSSGKTGPIGGEEAVAAGASLRNGALGERLSELDGVFRHRVDRIEPVKVPLVLISQVQRSGGTLLSQLFDGHPALLAHPSELYIGKPTKYFWPQLELSASPDALFDRLQEPVAVRHAREGYQKISPSGTHRVQQGAFPFIFLQDLQKKIFRGLLERFSACSQRAVLDCYVASYFGAWIDYQGAYRPPDTLRYWTAFAPRLMSDAANRAAFFADYPDGYWISILRDPVSWYASAARHQPSEYADVEKAVGLWRASSQSVLDGVDRHPRQVIVVRFEDLVTSPASVMDRLARLLGIAFHAELLCPSFNGIPILADSSFDVDRHGVLPETADRAGMVPEDAADFIRRQTADLYDRVCALQTL